MGNAYIETLDNGILSRGYGRQKEVNTPLIGKLGGQVPGPAPSPIPIALEFDMLRECRHETHDRP